MNVILEKSSLIIPQNELLREKILTLQEKMLERPQVELEVKHYYATNLYARELFIPKGTLYVGKLHKHAHIRIISKGCVSIMTEEGEVLMRAPSTMVTLAGTKRVGFAHEDTVITTVHYTQEKNLEKIENDLIAKDYEELKMFLETEKIKLEYRA